jgi:hypothetical protein
VNYLQERYQDAIKAAIQATVFHSDTTFSWLGHQSAPIHARVRTHLSPSLARSYLHFNLKLRLYANFYCRGFPTPVEPRAVLFDNHNTPFIQQLSGANAGQGYWKEYLPIRFLEGGEAIIAVEGLEVRVKQTVEQNTGTTPEEPLRIKLFKEFLGMSPGFYVALGDQELTPKPMQHLVRIYWHLMPDGAVPLMASLTRSLNHAGLPFHFKVLNDPTQFKRCDAAVLYFHQADYQAIADILQQIYPDISPWLRASMPVFSKPLAAGVGLAEDPGDGESFGLHRCGLVAEGLIQAYEQRLKSVEAKLEVVAAQFSAAGLSLATPFLNHQASDRYHTLAFKSPLRPVLAKALPATPLTANPAADLQTAEGIGQRLCQSAIWYDDQCNWLGAEPELNFGMQSLSSAWITLGGDLYGGTSGIGLFLAELYDVAPDPLVRRTALGAIRQALSQVETCPPPFRLGLYSGWIGIALAAARVGSLLNEPELLESAMALVKRTMRESSLGPEFDLVSGLAGGLTGFLAIRTILASALQEELGLEFAFRLGDALLERAVPEVAGCSWRVRATRSRNLVGFSHGTAGVAYALFELFHVTGAPRYRLVAEQAIAYERHWFSPKEGNWPDFREESARGKRHQQSLKFMAAWCHGAPGIALSRLRAYDLFGVESYRAEAVTALETTQRVIEHWLLSGTANYSLCHGLAGNAEPLLYASQVLGETHCPSIQLVNQLAMQGVARYGASPEQWPGGVKNGETPNLMLGLAGIGHFYLRLVKPLIPSVLLLQPEAFLPKSCSQIKSQSTLQIGA